MFDDMKFPRMARVVRDLELPPRIEAGPEAAREFARLGLSSSLRGKRVGITAGSRGITDALEIYRALVSCVRDAGGEPRIIAAMGSHGGGTASGQLSVLSSLGITEESVGAPVVACAECREIGSTADGLRAYALESALACDAIIAVNRVKPHTAFHGLIESGLCKMLVVGLGGPAGAASFHSRGSAELPDVLISSATFRLGALPIAAGFAVVENAADETAIVRGTLPDGFLTTDSELLNEARDMMPHLPTEMLDMLIIEEMGKDFSGTGIDTNVIGRMRIEGVDDPKRPAIKCVAVLDLSEGSHGNANGIGLTDVATRALVDKIDARATYLNCSTTGFLMRGSIPPHMDTERESLALALRSIGAAAGEVRAIQIPNTLHLREMFVSEPVLREMELSGLARVVEPLSPMTFDADGRLSRRIGRDGR